VDALDPFELAAVLLGFAFIQTRGPTDSPLPPFRIPGTASSGPSALHHRSRRRGSGTGSVHVELDFSYRKGSLVAAVLAGIIMGFA